MITKIFNGSLYHNKTINFIKSKIEKKNIINKISISIIILGNIYSSNLYVSKKIESCKKSFLNFIVFKFSNSVKNKTLLKIVYFLNNSNINGILIQKPLPKKIDKINLFSKISLKKDVDLLNPINFSYYLNGNIDFIKPCISQSVFFFLNKINFSYKNFNNTIFGFSDIVGKPICYEFLIKGLSVNIISKYDKNFKIISRKSDVILIGIGMPNFLSKEKVPFGSIIIDIGINYESCLKGDASLKDLYGKVSWITPVPCGIGPLTISFLLLNLFKLYLKF